jgi:hypothetical protein
VSVTDGGVLGARVLASVMRVRREACFHRDNDRKLGGGIQGLECCELLGDWGRAKSFRERGEKSKSEPFTKRRVRHPASFSCA